MFPELNTRPRIDRLVSSLRATRAAERAARSHAFTSWSNGPQIPLNVPIELRNDHKAAALETFLSAASKGETDALAKIIDSGQNVDARAVHIQGGRTALHAAVINGHVEAVRMLLRCGADANLGTLGLTRVTPTKSWRVGQTIWGSMDITGTPLDYAARVLGSKAATRTVIEIVRELLGAGAVGGEYLALWPAPASTGLVSEDRIKGCDERAQWLRLALRGGQPCCWTHDTHQAYPPNFRRAVRFLLLVVLCPTRVEMVRARDGGSALQEVSSMKAFSIRSDDPQILWILRTCL